VVTDPPNDTLFCCLTAHNNPFATWLDHWQHIDSSSRVSNCIARGLLPGSSLDCSEGTSSQSWRCGGYPQAAAADLWWLMGSQVRGSS